MGEKEFLRYFDIAIANIKEEIKKQEVEEETERGYGIEYDGVENEYYYSNEPIEKTYYVYGDKYFDEMDKEKAQAYMFLDYNNWNLYTYAGEEFEEKATIDDINKMDRKIEEWFINTYGEEVIE